MDQKERRRKWEELHNNPEARESLRPEILNSWERSYQYGVDPYMKKNPNIVTQAELERLRSKNEYLIRAARPVMENLVSFIAGTRCAVSLVDDNTTALIIMGDDEASEWANSGNMIEGSIWLERLVGTQGGSLGLAQGKPTAVWGYEHFTLMGSVCDGFYAPIRDNGVLIGGFGLTLPAGRGNEDSLGMVVMAAQHIESIMALRRAKEFQKEIVDTMPEGLMVVKEDGEIVCMNGECIKNLRINVGNPLGQNLIDILDPGVDNQRFVNMVTRNRSIADEKVTLNNHGDRFQCNITCNKMGQPGYTVINIRESRRVNHMIRNWTGGNAKFTFDDFIGNDSSLMQIMNNAKVAASTTSNLLITGESGTGKDLMAQAIHNHSNRRNYPFVAINCAALPRDLIASELFGYDDGAFTGARKGGNMGKFELADQGTIFLDEIGDMPLSLQATMLRVLEERRVTRLGGNKTIPVDVRIIAATNKDIELQVRKNRFRQDLYYRLAVVRLSIPPLRERGKDIELLANYFVARFCAALGKPKMNIAPDVIKTFMEYEWPGNVRELQNVIEGAVQLSDSKVLTIDQVEHQLLPITFNEQESNKYYSSVEEFEKQMIIDALKKNHGNRSETAKALGMSRRTLYRRMKKCGIS